MNQNKISGSVTKGIGLASKLGYPTINIKNELNINNGVYAVKHSVYGNGVAFVFGDKSEIHFLDTIDFKEIELSCDIIQKISPPNRGGGILDIFYKGLDQFK